MILTVPQKRIDLHPGARDLFVREVDWRFVFDIVSWTNWSLLKIHYRQTSQTTDPWIVIPYQKERTWISPSLSSGHTWHDSRIVRNHSDEKRLRTRLILDYLETSWQSSSQDKIHTRFGRRRICTRQHENEFWILEFQNYKVSYKNHEYRYEKKSQVQMTEE